MRKLFAFLLLWLGLLALPVTQAEAQIAGESPCPDNQACVVFLVVNGIGVEDQDTWDSQVLNSIQTPFFSSHPNVDQAYTKFDAVYNESFGKMKDIFGQSIFQWQQQDVDEFLANSSAWIEAHPDKALVLTYAMQKFEMNLAKYANDLAVIGDRIHAWQNIGYRVVLVGHSQGTYFTNEAYLDRLREAVPAGESALYPNPNRLSIVNFASAAGSIEDGREMYTTHCNDVILHAKLEPSC